MDPELLLVLSAAALAVVVVVLGLLGLGRETSEQADDAEVDLDEVLTGQDEVSDELAEVRLELDSAEEMDAELEPVVGDSAVVRVLRAHVRVLETVLEQVHDGDVVPHQAPSDPTESIATALAAHHRQVLLTIHAMGQRVVVGETPQGTVARVAAAVARLGSAGTFAPTLLPAPMSLAAVSIESVTALVDSAPLRAVVPTIEWAPVRDLDTDTLRVVEALPQIDPEIDSEPELMPAMDLQPEPEPEPEPEVVDEPELVLPVPPLVPITPTRTRRRFRHSAA